MRHRFMRKKDLRVCTSLLPSEFITGNVSRQQMPELWSRLLTNEQMIALVIEDTSPSSIAAFGMSVFVSDAFLDAYLSRPRPHLATLIYDAVDAGRSPVLGHRQVAMGNAGEGLNLVVLHYCQRNWDFSNPETIATLYASHSSVRLAHEGYNIRRLVEESYGPQKEVVLQGGAVLKSDFGLSTSAPSALLGLYREDLKSPAPSTTATFLFRPLRPRFHLSEAEQRVLLRAIIEESTDEQIADALGVSLDAIKKIWRNVYQRVSAVDANVLLAKEAEPEFRRGVEKRRRMIAYLRMHLEELRPYPRSG